MKRWLAFAIVLQVSASSAQIDPDLKSDWMARWEKNIVSDSRNRYCDKESGEEIGWLISPFLNGFYNGYLATGDSKWIDRFVDWTDSWFARAVKEPDGFVGWPKAGSGGAVADQLYTDSLLGEAMGLRPVVLLSGMIQTHPALKAKYGAKARSYLSLAEKTFQKWESRGCWREVKDGGLWVVPEFGIDKGTGHWTEGYGKRMAEGFSNPANKENAIAEWMLALWDVTKKPVYRQRAEKWFRLMKSRIRSEGKHLVWNYWDPAGPWDYTPDGTARHWVGVHPNGGYYGIDVAAMVLAYEHGIVFHRSDIDQLIATNRDFMWNHEVKGAKFSRIDGGTPDDRWRNSPGVLWIALVPYDVKLRQVFETNHHPASWGGLSVTPWYFWRMSRRG